jgi:hypothetical protein
VKSEWFVFWWLRKDLMSLACLMFHECVAGLGFFELPYNIYISNWLQNVNRVSTDIIYHKYLSSALTFDAYIVRAVIM